MAILNILLEKKKNIRTFITFLNKSKLLLTYNYNLTIFMCKTIGMFLLQNTTRGGSRTAATSKMEHFLITVNGFQPLIIITKCSILDIAAGLDPPLMWTLRLSCHFDVTTRTNSTDVVAIVIVFNYNFVFILFSVILFSIMLLLLLFSINLIFASRP